MARIFADISNYQWTGVNNDYGWQNKLKNKYNAKSVSILASDGTEFRQPDAGYQAYNAYKVFGSFSCYHFFRGYGKAEANNFLHALSSIGADKSTIVVCDAETLVYGLTGAINEWIDAVYNAGYHHIYVYSMASAFNYGSNYIQSGNLHHGAKLWIASLGGYRPAGADAWQYTWSGNVDGTNVDLDYDYVGELSRGIDDKPTYHTHNGLYQMTASVNVYHDKQLKKPRRVRYGAGSRIYSQQIVKDGSVPRIRTQLGYISANKDFSKLIK